jgi:hypothetical protein
MPCPSNDYAFPGLRTFISRATGKRQIHHLDRAIEIWHVQQIHDILSEIPKHNHVSQRDLIGHALKLREALAVTLRGIDAAISEVTEEFELYDEG